MNLYLFLKGFLFTTRSCKTVGQQKNTSKPVNQTVFTGFLFCEAEIIKTSFLMKN
ncbi:hypothetical protein HMPREF0201_01696 [Cedecea davisae DSM 4568]|uniref:Uncharacterized protein n=1 Tax=Cedecea davisae DSM 4568 TaxID=566551 RepID=S3IYZ6_9ENTR|nr:hypothetical protein HMPREF0201_01696 [Cedecea davisae DSM 4568]